ncbi:MAG: hypothetical protein R3C56_28750 [Pirellulaceae bacterium]
MLESFAVGEVMDALCKIPIATDEPQAFREVILHGLRMEQDDESPAPAIKLLSYWTGENHATLAEWQTWFAVRFPIVQRPNCQNSKRARPGALTPSANTFCRVTVARGTWLKERRL